jgi:hypothetical protein
MSRSSGQPRKASPLVVIKTVLSAFLGIRKRSQHEQEAVRLTPGQIIVTGVLAAAVFVASLMLLVRLIISNATN